MNYRNIIILGFGQSLAISAASMIVFVGPIIGTKLAPYPSLSTLPMAITIVGVALFTIPASMIMKKIGRQYGFIGALSFSIIVEIGAIYSIYIESFVLFTVMMMLIGGNLAFAQQYRFAAAESVESQHVSRAISLVMLGGVLSGIIGPYIGKNGKDLLPFGDFTGSFVLLIGIHLSAIILLLGLKKIQIHQTENVATAGQRPLLEIIKAHKYMIAALSGATGYVVMVLIMTATPLSMHTVDGFSLDDTALVIQGHIIGMFLPSLFTGYLVEKFGVFRIILAGLFCMLGSIMINVNGHVFWNYLSSLVLLGVGWNFMFIGGTILLTQCYRSAERFKAQAVNDFFIFGVQAISSLLSGTLFFALGWETLNYIALPLLGGLLFVLFLRKQFQIKALP